MKKYMIEQNGRSMIEMLGVLAIVGVLSVAGIAGYSKAMAKYKVNRVIDQVTMVAANLKTTFAGQGDYAGLDDAEVAYNLGVFPEEAVKDCVEVKEGVSTEKYSDGCLRNGMGGTFAVKVSGASTDYRADDSKYTFDLYVSGLSKDACATLLTADWGAASGLKDSLVIKDGTVDMAKSSNELMDKAKPEKATSKIAAASSSCNCGTNNTCAAGWRFY